MHTSAKILVVEDEFHVALDITSRLSAMGFDPVGTAETFEDAIAKAAVENPDAVIMDIHIRGDKTGIDAAKIIWEKFRIPIVYLTGSAEEEIFDQAMDTRPMGYILKPFRDIDLRMQLSIALQQKRAFDDMQERIHSYQSIMQTIQPGRTENEIVFIKDNKQISTLRVADIAYLEAMDNYTMLYTSQGQHHIISGLLKDIVERISAHGIIRIHRSYAIALQHIRNVEENAVSVCGRILPVSRSYRERFYAAIDPI